MEFFSAFRYFFRFFFSLLVIFKLSPIFGQPNPSGCSSFCPPRPCLKWCYSSSTYSRLVSCLLLSSSLNPPLSKHLPIFYFTSSPLITSNFSSFLFISQKPKIHFETLTSHIQIGRPRLHLELVLSERGRFPCNKTPHLTMIILVIRLGKPSIGFPLGTSILVGFLTFLI